MCRRRQNPHQLEYSTPPLPVHRQRGGCCRAKRERRLQQQNQLSATVKDSIHGPVPQTIPQQVVIDKNTHNSCGSRRQGPRPPMAALIIGSFGFGTQFFREKREERRARKAALEAEEVQAFEAARRAALSDAQRAQRQGGHRTDEHGQVSKEVVRDEEAPPPSYDDAVKERSRVG